MNLSGTLKPIPAEQEKLGPRQRLISGFSEIMHIVCIRLQKTIA